MVTREAAVALAALTALNLFNYFARYLPSAAKDAIKDDLGLSDFQTGVMFTSFISCYMIVSPLVGFIGDRRLISRKVLIVAGVLIWSAATVATGLCTSFGAILVPRVLFGVGEAIFGTLAPAVLCDHFAPEQRSVALSIFMTATPIGCALGYGIAGEAASLIGWRYTFILCGAPGLLSLLYLIPREPEPGAMDPVSEKQDDPPPSLWEGCVIMAKNKNFMFSVAGYVAVTFGMGGFSDWLPTLFVRYRGMSMGFAGMLNGAIVVVAGLTGTIAGCAAGERLERLGVKNSLMAVSAVTMLLSAVIAGAALWFINASTLTVEGLFLFAVFFGWWYNGPINSVINNCVPANLRSRANGFSILAIHLLGDSISPSVIGAISDSTGGDLRGALTVVPATLAVSAEFWFLGWWLAPPLLSPESSKAKVKADIESGDPKAKGNFVDGENKKLLGSDGEGSSDSASYGSINTDPADPAIVRMPTPSPVPQAPYGI